MDLAAFVAGGRSRAGNSTQDAHHDSRLLLQQSQANRAQAARDLQVARVRLALLRDLPLQAAGAASAAGGSQSQGSNGSSTQSRQGTQQGAAQSPLGAAQSQTGQFGGTTP